MLQPAGAHSTGTACLFMHGGGWVACEPTLLIPSVTPYARAGFPTFAIAYPLSPGAKFPVALHAVLLALAHLEALGFRRVIIVGESAGGNLATLAATVLSNPELISRLEHCDPSLDFARCRNLRLKLLGVVSCYGILDRKSWASAAAESYTEWVGEIFELGLAVCLRCYTNRRAQDLMTLVDLLESSTPLVKQLPPMLLLVGDADPLVHSSRLAHRLLVERGFVATLEVYKGAPHAFLTLPPAWMPDNSDRCAKPATEQVTRFLAELDASAKRSPHSAVVADGE